MSEEKHVPGLSPARFREAAVARNSWVIVAAAGVPFKNVLQSEYWVHVAAKLRPYDRIEIQAEDGAYWGELVVLSTGPSWARVAAIRFVELDAFDATVRESEYEGLAIAWRGSLAQWCVLRKSDTRMLAEGLRTRGEAMARAVEMAQQAQPTAAA